MLVSARGAAEILLVAGLTRDEARHLSLAGFAGPGQRTSGAVLYDEEQVRELAMWPTVEDETVDRLCPFGMFVGRVARGRPIDVAGDRVALADAVKGGWKVSLLARVLIAGRIERFGPMPFLATVCGYVGFGADIVALEVDRLGRTTFTLSDAGSWFEGFDQRCLPAGAGRSSFIWGRPPPYHSPG